MHESSTRSTADKMKTFLVALAFCVGSISATSICADTFPELQGKCLETCEGYGEETADLGVFGCLSVNIRYKCCLRRVQPETTTVTTEMPTSPETTNAPTDAPSPPMEDCGRKPSEDPVQARILGGTKANTCEWPWQVSIRGRTAADKKLIPVAEDTLVFCSGVLIDEETVVTTAGCVMLAHSVVGGDPAENILVTAGDTNTERTDFDENLRATEEVFRISKAIIYTNFTKADPMTYNQLSLVDSSADFEANNLAILKLATPATFKKCIRKVCPPTTHKDSCWTTKKCVIAGWGNIGEGFEPSKDLLTAEVELIRPDLWKIAASINNATIEIKPLTTYARFVDTATDKNTCLSDNGGMVVCKNEQGRWALEGLINVPKFDFCKAGDRFLVTDVGAAYDWIMENSMQGATTPSP